MAALLSWEYCGSLTKGKGVMTSVQTWHLTTLCCCFMVGAPFLGMKGSIKAVPSSGRLELGPPHHAILCYHFFFGNMMHPQLLWHLFGTTCVVMELATIILSSIDDTSEGCAFPAANGPHQI